MFYCGMSFRFVVVVMSVLLLICALHAQPFEDVTDSVGLTGLYKSPAAWIDFNNDGWIDLYISGQLWRNVEGRRFELVETAGITGRAVWADMDNDGYIDVFAWGSGKYRLFRNLGGCGFEDLSHTLPEIPIEVCRGAVWGDFNNNGLVVLYVGGYEIWGKAHYVDVILENRGNGKFELVWKSPGKPQPARGITTSDYNEDGALDIYVSNYRLRPNRLWQNNGKGEFKDVAAQTGTAGNGPRSYGHTIGSAWGDLDNDGHLDLFVGNFSHPPASQDRPMFLRNHGPEGNFTFKDMSAKAKLHWQESYASPALGDFDNDGWLDLFFTTVYSGDSSVLYRNMGAWRFENVTKKHQLTSEKTYQAAWADFDNDGYLDMVTGARLYRNPGGSNSWIRVQLVGTRGVNLSAIGAQVRVKLGDYVLTRQVETGTGEGNQNDMRMHFGLGDHTGPVDVEIRWPDGHRQTVTTHVNQTLRVVRSR